VRTSNFHRKFKSSNRKFQWIVEVQITPNLQQLVTNELALHPLISILELVRSIFWQRREIGSNFRITWSCLRAQKILAGRLDRLAVALKILNSENNKLTYQFYFHYIYIKTIIFK
jgi:hypothetical protein